MTRGKNWPVFTWKTCGYKCNAYEGTFQKAKHEMHN